MCKARPTTNNGEEISSSNTAIGLVNFSAEEWSLSKPHHRTEIVSIMIFIILILFGIYKLSQRCIKKRNNKQNTSEPTTNHQPPLQPEHPAQPTTNPRTWLPPDDTTPSQPNIRISPTKVKPSSPTHAVQLNGNSGQEGYNRYRVIQKEEKPTSETSETLRA